MGHSSLAKNGKDCRTYVGHQRHGRKLGRRGVAHSALIPEHFLQVEREDGGNHVHANARTHIDDANGIELPLRQPILPGLAITFVVFRFGDFGYGPSFVLTFVFKSFRSELVLPDGANIEKGRTTADANAHESKDAKLGCLIANCYEN